MSPERLRISWRPRTSNSSRCTVTTNRALVPTTVWIPPVLPVSPVSPRSFETRRRCRTPLFRCFDWLRRGHLTLEMPSRWGAVTKTVVSNCFSVFFYFFLIYFAVCSGVFWGVLFRWGSTFVIVPTNRLAVAAVAVHFSSSWPVSISVGAVALSPPQLTSRCHPREPLLNSA